MMTMVTWQHRMSDDMKIAGLSERTEVAYLRAMRQLVEFHRGGEPDALTETQLRDYLVWLRGEKRAAPGTLKIAINGIRFYYRNTSVRDWKVLEKFRIPSEKRLPTAQTIAEVQRIIRAVIGTVPRVRRRRTVNGVRLKWGGYSRATTFW